MEPVTDQAARDHQVSHIKQQVDGCQDGHSQSLVPVAHVSSELISAGRITGSLGLALAILWNSAFKWVYLSFSPLLFAFLLFTAICKASSDSHFLFCNSFSWG